MSLTAEQIQVLADLRKIKISLKNHDTNNIQFSLRALKNDLDLAKHRLSKKAKKQLMTSKNVTNQTDKLLINFISLKSACNNSNLKQANIDINNIKENLSLGKTYITSRGNIAINKRGIKVLINQSLKNIKLKNWDIAFNTLNLAKEYYGYDFNNILNEIEEHNFIAYKHLSSVLKNKIDIFIKRNFK